MHISKNSSNFARKKLQRAMQLKKGHFGLIGIIVAAVLIEVTAGAMYYTSQRIIQSTMERLVKTEMNAIYLCVRNKLVPVEVTIYNEAWVVSDYLNSPKDIYSITQNLVAHNSSFIGSGVAFIPNYYPLRARHFEPYSVRQADGSIKTMQLGSNGENHTGDDYYRVPIEEGRWHWSEPYMDMDGAHTVVTTFGVPVLDSKGKRVAVVYADIALDWLGKVAEEAKQYRSTQRFIISGAGSLLAGEDCPIYRAALKHVQSNENREGYSVITDDEGIKRHVFYHPIGGHTDWVLINVLDDDEVFGALKEVRLTLWILLLIGLCVMAFLLWRAVKNTDELQRINTEKARIDAELKVANEIQRAMLPHGEVKDERIRVKGYLKPAREVGGDLYDYFLRDEKLFFCIGDVTGKGAASAMLMAVTHSLFRSASTHETNPARIMTTMNEASAAGNENNMFVTLFIGVLDLPTGKLRYCNAGHDKPIKLEVESLKSKVESQLVESLPCKANLPVGAFLDTKYAMEETTLEAGSMLFLYTDGLTEAKNKLHKQFGLERVKERLKVKGERMKDPQAVIDTMNEAVHAFVGEEVQSDDLAMLAIRYAPAQFQSTLNETLTLTNEVREVARLSTFVKQVLAQVVSDKHLAGQIRLAIEEAVINVIDYAYPAGTKGSIEIHLQSDGKILRVQIIDSGAAFDPTAKEKADTSLSAEERQIGGLGILLVRELMDSINYERAEHRNVLTLVKTLNR